MAIQELRKGYASVVLPARPEWTGDSRFDLMHTGCLSVLADSACGIAVGAALEGPEPFATLDLRMDYLRPTLAERDLICKAECVRLSRSVAFVRGELFQPGSDEPVATVGTAFMRATARGTRDPSKALKPTSTAPQWAIDAHGAMPALPPGRSPYVDYLAIRRFPSEGDTPPIFKLPFRPDLIGNPMLPALHGGVLAGFAETAAVLHLILTTEETPSGVAARAVDFSIDYLRSAKAIDTYASCTTVRLGARVALVQMSIWQTDPTRPVAMARAHLLLPKTEG